MVEYHVPNFPSCSCWCCGICAFIIMYVYPNAPCMEYVPALAQKITQPCVVVCLLWSSLLLSWRHLGFAISKSPDSIPTSRSCTSNRFPTMPKGPPHSSMSGTNQPRHKWWYGRATSSTWTYFCHENWSCPPNIRYYLTNLRATKVTSSRVSRGQNMAKPISEAHFSRFLFFYIQIFFYHQCFVGCCFFHHPFLTNLGDGSLPGIWPPYKSLLAAVLDPAGQFGRVTTWHRNNVYNKYIICHI